MTKQDYSAQPLIDGVLIQDLKVNWTEDGSFTELMRFGAGAKGFMPFYMWAISKWAPGLEIDRIDNDKGYSPENCHFVTHTENINNNSLTHQYLVNGIEIISRKELIRRFAACSRFQVDRRLAAGLSLLEALVTPLKTEKKRKTPLEMLESVEIISSPEPPSIKYMSEAQQKAYYSKRSVG